MAKIVGALILIIKNSLTAPTKTYQRNGDLVDAFDHEWHELTIETLDNLNQPITTKVLKVIPRGDGAGANDVICADNWEENSYGGISFWKDGAFYVYGSYGQLIETQHHGGSN